MVRGAAPQSLPLLDARLGRQVSAPIIIPSDPRGTVISTNLREKKRELLRSTIERTAVALVLRHGYANVTVDMICTDSMASQRTFFNYFGSKEAAILGPPPPDPDPQLVADFVHRPEGDVLSDLARLMARALSQHGDMDLELWRDRREVIRSEPELLRAHAARMAAKDEQLAQLVLRRLRVQNGLVEDDLNAGEELTDQARLIVNLWWGIARYAMQLWSDRDGSDPQQIMDDLLILLDRVKRA
jgi:AcrR family transcriptional regulator